MINNYLTFYNKLIEYIPSLKESNVEIRKLILNIDLIKSHAENNDLVIEFGYFEDNIKDYDILNMALNKYSENDYFVMLENGNIRNLPFEFSLLNLKSKLNEFEMPIFCIGDAVVIWLNRKVITLFHHTGYYANIFCNTTYNEISKLQ